MTNWKEHKIEEKWYIRDFICFKLDKFVPYSSLLSGGGMMGTALTINCTNSYPFDTYQVGDILEIDWDRTRQASKNMTFDDLNIVRKPGSSFGIVITKAKFKRHLHQNCHRWWFSRDASNAKYKNRQGTRDLYAYDDKYTIKIREILEDPGVINDRKISELPPPGTGHAATGLITAISELLAFPTGGMSLISGALGVGAFEMLEQGNAEARSRIISMPRDIRFTLSADSSRWVAEEIPVDGIRQVAINICEWSNEVYRERYEQQYSSEYQYYIEYRPPTPS